MASAAADGIDEDRIYAVSLQLHEPTRVRAISDRADVSKETARDYPRWFTELGILRRVSESPDAFERNEQYFEWRRIQRLQSRAEDELLDRFEQLTRREREYRERCDADGPGDVDALEHVGYTDLESVWMELQEWRTGRRRIRELERARQNRDDGERALA